MSSAVLILSSALLIACPLCGILYRRVLRAETKNHALEIELASLSASRDDTLLREQLGQLQQKLTQYEEEIRQYTVHLATLDSQKEALNARLIEQAAFEKKLQEKTQMQFENLAHRIFDEKNSQSKQNLVELLTPLKEDLSGFKKHIAEAFGTHAKEQFALKNEIATLVKTSGQMQLQTENLTKALKGDVKTQGYWGELVLERILEASGLRKGEEYRVQASGMGLKHPQDGSTKKPDYIVMFPENRHAIIDSKVTLTAFERVCAEENDVAKAEHIKQFMHSVRSHVKDLEARRYQDIEGLDTPEYVLMFMPIEAAYALALQQDPELHLDAWNRKVIIVCPTTLYGILKIIGSMWKLDRQNKNAQLIAERGGQLYDKIAGFIDDMTALGRSLDKAQEQFDGAFKKLSKGRGNIIRQTEYLRDLGVKNAKQISPSLLDEESATHETNTPEEALDAIEAPKDAA